VVEPPMISVIAATNSLLINATAEQHAAISLVIAYVDAERGESSINYVVYPLENQDPEKLKGILESLITGRTVAADRERKVERTTTTVRQPGQPAQPTQPQVAAVPPAEAAEQGITIVADPSTYSLLVYASKKNQQWISSVIKELDKYRPQVLLDVTLVEINRDDVFKYDMDMVTKVGSFGTPTSLGRVTAPSFGTFTSDTIVEGSSLGGTATAFYGDGHVPSCWSTTMKKVPSSPKTRYMSQARRPHMFRPQANPA
jgi:general secretion pathway protein D